MANSWSVRRRPAVFEDLAAIWEHIAEYEPDTADRLIGRFDRAIGRLAEFPRLGSMRETLDRRFRGYLVGQYLIVYLLDNDLHEVEIVRIVDARRDLPVIFRGFPFG